MARIPKTEPTMPKGRAPKSAPAAPKRGRAVAEPDAGEKPKRGAKAAASVGKPAVAARGLGKAPAPRGASATTRNAPAAVGRTASKPAIRGKPAEATAGTRSRAVAGDGRTKAAPGVKVDAVRVGGKPKAAAGSSPSVGAVTPRRIAKIVPGAAVSGTGAVASVARSGARAVAKAGAGPTRRASDTKPQARTALGAGNVQVKPRARPAPKSPPGPTTDADALAAAEPKRPRTRKRPAPMAPDRLELLVNAARKSLEDDKAEDVRVLDVTGRASFTDRIIIATGLADRQIQAMATHLEEALAKEGLRLKRNAIEASPDWVLIDCGDMVIHLFKPEARETFRLEKMWGEDSPKADSGSGYEPG